MKEQLAEKIAGEITMSETPGLTMRKWREDFGISQQDLARKLQLSPSVISDYEKGRRKSPGIMTVGKIVRALVAIDEDRGGPILKRFTILGAPDVILDIREFSRGIRQQRLIDSIDGEALHMERGPGRAITGYTVVDSLNAILKLTAMDYLKVYGWSMERALIFTDVEYGRSPMIAIRSHPMTPAMVVFHQPTRVDPLAVKLASLEQVTLVTCPLPLDEMLERLKSVGDSTQGV
jgi:putative transcriptional regulator